MQNAYSNQNTMHSQLYLIKWDLKIDVFMFIYIYMANSRAQLVENGSMCSARRFETILGGI